MRYGVWASAVLGPCSEDWVHEEGRHARPYRAEFNDELDAEELRAQLTEQGDGLTAYFVLPLDLIRFGGGRAFRPEWEAARDRVKTRLRKRLAS